MYNSPQLVLDEVDDNVDEPDEEELFEYARAIGIDVIQEPQLMWIARAGITAPLPSGWKPVQTNDDDVYFYNFSNNQSTWEHPSDDKYRQMVKEERSKLHLKGKIGNSTPSRPVSSLKMERNEPHFGQFDKNTVSPSSFRGANRLASLQRTKPKPITLDFPSQTADTSSDGDTLLNKKAGASRPKTSRGSTNQEGNQSSVTPAFALRKGGSKFLKGGKPESSGILRSKSEESELDFASPPDILKLEASSDSDDGTERSNGSMHLNIGGAHVVLDAPSLPSPKKYTTPSSQPHSIQTKMQKEPNATKNVSRSPISTEILDERHKSEVRVLKEEFAKKVRVLENNLSDQYEIKTKELNQSHEQNLDILKNKFETEIKVLKKNHEVAVSKLKESHQSQMKKLKTTHEEEINKESQEMHSKIQKLRQEHKIQLSELQSVEGIEKELQEKKASIQNELKQIDSKKCEMRGRYEKEMADCEAEWESTLAKCKMQWKNKISKLEAESSAEYNSLLAETLVKKETLVRNPETESSPRPSAAHSFQNELEILRKEVERLKNIGEKLDETVEKSNIQQNNSHKKEVSTSSSDYPKDPSMAVRSPNNTQQNGTVEHENIGKISVPIPVSSTSVYISNGMSVPDAIHTRLNELQYELSNLSSEIQGPAFSKENDLNNMNILNPDFLDRLIDKRWIEFQKGNAFNKFSTYSSLEEFQQSSHPQDFDNQLKDLKMWLADFEKKASQPHNNSF